MKIIKVSKDLIINPNLLSKEILNRISVILKREGYDIRGAEDIKQIMNKIIERSGAIKEEGFKHILDAYKEAIQNKNKRQENLKNKKEEKLKYQNINWKRLKELGYTNNPKEAGYIDLNGNLLDFSGKRDGGVALII